MPIVFWISVVVIFIISFLWALSSMYSEIAKPKHLKTIKDKLQKEKILYKKQ